MKRKRKMKNKKNSNRCIATGKLTNGREVILAKREVIIDYAKSMGYLTALLFIIIFSITLASAEWTSNLNDKLLVNYDFNISTPNITDNLGVHNLTIGSITYGQGIINGSLVNTGGASFKTGNISYNDFAFGYGNFSINLWINTSSTAIGGLFSTINTFSVGDWAFVYRGDQQNGSVQIAESSGLGTGFLYSNLRNSRFIMITAVREGTGLNQFKLYINGSNVVNATLSYYLDSNDGLYQLLKVNLGADYYFVGDIDELSIYNRSLNSSEVLQHYNNGNGLSYQSTGDFTYLQFINVTSNTATFNLSGIININLTILNSNGTQGINFNGINYSLGQSINFYNFTFNQSGSGNYPYYFFAYGSGLLNNFNQSQNYNFVINALPVNPLGLFTFDFSTQTNMLLFIILIVVSFFLLYIGFKLLSSVIIFLLGLMMVFNGVNFLISLIVVIIGIVILTSEEQQ